MSATKGRILLGLLALLLPSLASAQSGNGSFIQYRPSPSVLQSLQVIGGTVTCGSTTATCVVTFPLTATGGADVAGSFQALADLSSSDNVVRFGDAGSATLFQLFGGGNVTISGNATISGGFLTLGTGTISVPSAGAALFGTSSNHTLYINDTAKTLTESSATDVWLVNVAAGAVAGGEFEYAVYAADATNHQVRKGRVVWSAVNEAGTEACVLGTPEEIDNTPTGTLTATITCVTTPTNGVLLQVNAASSLTQTTLNVKSRISKDHGVGTIVAQ